MQPEIVDFITTQKDRDLIVSFAIRDEPFDSVNSLTLLRQLEFEPFLPLEDRGVYVSHEGFPGIDDDDRLKSLRWQGEEVQIETRDGHQFRLDVGAVEPEQKRAAVKVLRAMRFDHAFGLRVEL
ncbi:hypothetical protein [Thiohalocapsa sp. ML1]|jgi:hypothetical protein|uniref:hypothetical protein n=1 Tax=Thiohalocapsa sp. ML1 TaxID=1431688 RepID=UPI000731F8B8|nr:hypothetical protein [Thiohalocapsa sp. ML1]